MTLCQTPRGSAPLTLKMLPPVPPAPVGGGGTPFPISVIDLATLQEIHVGDVTGTDHGSIDICSDGTLLTTSFQTNTLHRAIIDELGNISTSLDPTISLLSANTYCAPGSQSGVALDFNTQTIQSFALPGLVPVDTRPVSSFPQAAVVSPTGDRVFVRSFQGTVDAFGYDPVTGTLSPEALFSFDSTPAHFRAYLGIDQINISSDGSKLYMGEAGQLSIFDASNGNRLASITDPSIVEPTGICLGQRKPRTDSFLFYDVKVHDRDHHNRHHRNRRYDDDEDDDRDDDRKKKGRRSPHRDKQIVSLSDLFDVPGQARRFEIEEVERFGNPTKHEFQGTSTQISNPDTHLIAYEIDPLRGRSRHQRISGIVVSNQFGEITLDTKKAEFLLAPALADLSQPIPDTELPDQFTTDYFKCYDVEPTRSTPKFSKTQVSVEDEFGQPTILEIRKPKYLCNPVSTDGSEIQNPKDHLLCYKAKRAKGEARFRKVRGIHTLSQFGALELDAKKEKEFCVLSEVDMTNAASRRHGSKSHDD